MESAIHGAVLSSGRNYILLRTIVCWAMPLLAKLMAAGMDGRRLEHPGHDRGRGGPRGGSGQACGCRGISRTRTTANGD